MSGGEANVEPRVHELTLRPVITYLLDETLFGSAADRCAPVAGSRCVGRGRPFLSRWYVPINCRYLGPSARRGVPQLAWQVPQGSASRPLFRAWRTRSIGHLQILRVSLLGAADRARWPHASWAPFTWQRAIRCTHRFTPGPVCKWARAASTNYL